jgi:hypothetical protein
MAAHALTIINQILASEITEKTCLDVLNACDSAPGFDIPSVNTTDWDALYEAAQYRQIEALKLVLEIVRKHVSYQEAYRTIEHLRTVRHAYINPDKPGWLERDQKFETLSLDEHIALATAEETSR